MCTYNIPFPMQNENHLKLSQINSYGIFMRPTSEKLRGHIGLGLSVRLSVRHAFWQPGNSRTAYARIFKFHI